MLTNEIARVTVESVNGHTNVTIYREYPDRVHWYQDVWPESLERLKDYIESRCTMVDHTVANIQEWYISTDREINR